VLSFEIFLDFFFTGCFSDSDELSSFSSDTEEAIADDEASCSYSDSSA
jgi:hypothetical protein